MDKIIILGCGGHAKSVVDIIEKQKIYEISGFVDEKKDHTIEYKGYKIIGTDDDLQKIYDSGIKNAAIGIGYLGTSDIREKLYCKLINIGFKLPCIVDPTAVLASDVMLGDATVIGKGAIVNACSIIGKMAIINSGAIVEHDCVVGDYAHVSVGAILCGGVKVGKRSFIGAGTTVIHGVVLGDSCIVGAGSTVLKNVSGNSKKYGLIR